MSQKIIRERTRLRNMSLCLYIEQNCARFRKRKCIFANINEYAYMWV